MIEDPKRSVTPVTILSVTGMTCSNCARHVTDAIQKVSGVKLADVKLDARQAKVFWATEQPDIDSVIKSIEREGYGAKVMQPGDPAEKRLQLWKINLWIGVLGTLPLMLGEWVFHLENERWFQWLAFVLAGMVQLFPGAQFYRGAWQQLKIRSANMDTLVALGSTTAFAFSVWALLTRWSGHLYFMEAAAIVTIITIGHWLESRACSQASTALKRLLHLAPQTAKKINPEAWNSRFSLSSTRLKPAEIEVPVSELNIGDLIALRPGEHVPTDGEVVEGTSSVNESMLTGESLPSDKRTGAKVFAGTINLNGNLIVRVTATGEQTALANIVAAVQRAQNSRATIQRIADRISSVFVPVVVIIALAAGLWWAFAQESALRIFDSLAPYLWHAHPPHGLAAGFIIAAGVLIVACPCAMGLATPVAIMAGSNAAAKRGILIRDAIALEKAGAITAIVLDKTGTVTSGELAVTGPWTPNDSKYAIQEAQNVAGTLAQRSNHPVSKVLATFAGTGITLENWKEIPGSGIEARMVSKTGATEHVRLGALRWLQDSGVVIPQHEQLEKWKDEGASLVGVSKGTLILGIFALRDFLKRDASRIAKQLQNQGLKTYLLTGDNLRTANAIAKEVGITAENVFAEVRPEQKAYFIKQLQEKGHRVAFVGDGINDAPALEQADLGIAVSKASDIAREAADIILLNSEIEAVPQSLALARATLRTIKQNLFWAFFYNAAAIPLAVLGFLSPVLCAAAMGLSDLIVIGNALRLRWRNFN